MKILLTLVFLSLVSFTAQASEVEGTACLEGQGCFSDLRLIDDACENPGHYNHQNPPANIQIHCSMVDLSWRMGKPGTMSFPGLRILTTGVTTNKLGILLGNIDFDFPMQQSTFPCPTFAQTRGTGAFSYNVTCDEIDDLVAANQGTVDYCNTNMVALVEADESLLVTTPTGKTATGCGMMGRGGHGQR